MEIHVFADAAPQLKDESNFKSFKVVSHLSGDLLEGLASAPSSASLAMDGEDYVWIPDGLVVALSQQGDDPEWMRQFEAMVAKAKQYGWIDNQSRIRAHVEKASA
ncbi:hypothetical protein J2T08_005721 [Neorhizobium galegae]|uniref:hypothetical protein n=1 Tax=Neorhizobium galegae TaxID=399 RepID=UPI00277D629C|nr:hypothetical protein [Neorhizobium galegae]MDQ0137777.1 hypothetical protein [Neorhizobium galegae]